MKERPILFKGPLVRAILAGQKTVTRRVVSERALKMISTGAQVGECPELPDNGPVHPWIESYYTSFCPHGFPGDRLWVRETFALLGNEDGVCIDWNDRLVKGDERDAARIFKASCTVGDYGLWQVPDKADWKPDTDALQYEGRWRPSIHMPRWASRILLEITAVRIERVQDITEEQARAEGITDGGCHNCGNNEPCGCDCPAPSAVDSFCYLWNEINGAGAWEANPWVWVIEFKRVTP